MARKIRNLKATFVKIMKILTLNSLQVLWLAWFKQDEYTKRTF